MLKQTNIILLTLTLLLRVWDNSSSQHSNLILGLNLLMETLFLFYFLFIHHFVLQGLGREATVSSRNNSNSSRSTYSSRLHTRLRKTDGDLNKHQRPTLRSVYQASAYTHTHTYEICQL